MPASSSASRRRDYRQDGQTAGPVNPLDGMAFQRHWESRAYSLGGGDYRAPGQLVGDFIRRQRSSGVGDVLPSYKPGVHFGDLAERGHESLPVYVLDAIREALPAFERQIKGFAMPDAVLTGVETRTSSPLRITRGKDLQSLNVRGLYPAGEGAGLCRRHHVRGCRWHRGGRGLGAVAAGRATGIGQRDQRGLSRG